jgi:hypothetical protein
MEDAEFGFNYPKTKQMRLKFTAEELMEAKSIVVSI